MAVAVLLRRNAMGCMAPWQISSKFLAGALDGFRSGSWGQTKRWNPLAPWAHGPMAPLGLAQASRPLRLAIDLGKNVKSGRSLAGKQSIVYCLGPNLAARKNICYSVLGGFFKQTRIVCKSVRRPVGVFSMLANPPKCHIRQNSKLI